MKSREFKIPRDPYCMGYKVYKKTMIEIKSGLTVLVGCNGAGKSTLLIHIKELLKEEKIPFISFNNLTDGGSNSKDHAGFIGDFVFLATALESSEGEEIILNLGKFAKKTGEFIRDNKNKEELWILLDAADSGLSVDNVIDLKGLFNLIIKDKPDSDIYILISANEYELARKEKCFDVQNGKYVTFSDYEDYRNFVLETRKEKDRRKSVK